MDTSEFSVTYLFGSFGVYPALVAAARQGCFFSSGRVRVRGKLRERHLFMEDRDLIFFLFSTVGLPMAPN